MKRLTAAQLEQARDALVDGFYNWAALKQLAAFALDINLEAKVGRGALDSVAYDLLEFTEAEGWTELLLRDALARKPGNESLRTVATLLGLAPAPFSGASAGAGGYEALVAKVSPLESTGTWRKRMVACERKVCQILADDQAIGTGFLVGPGLVMSNWHVFEAGNGAGTLAALERYAARFDFRGADGQAPADAGIEVAIDAKAGYLDASHKIDLDYVLLSLDRKLGDEPIPSGEARGWLALGTREFEPNETCLVLQHPASRTLEVAPGSVLGWVADRKGDIYEHMADTLGGSSGSPCFAPDWTLLAMHHRTDPVSERCNRAIATSAILKRMRDEGTLRHLPRQT